MVQYEAQLAKCLAGVMHFFPLLNQIQKRKLLPTFRPGNKKTDVTSNNVATWIFFRLAFYTFKTTYFNDWFSNF